MIAISTTTIAFPDENAIHKRVSAVQEPGMTIALLTSWLKEHG